MNAITRRNLEQAMRDEGFAFARYMLYGRKARAHGNLALAEVLESLADIDVFDYFMHEADLIDFASGSDVENLRAAITAETQDAADVYRTYEQQAREVGEHEAAAQLERIRLEKRRRQEQLTWALSGLEQPLPHPHRILVVADESCRGSGLCDEVSYRAGRVPSEVMIVAPALTTSRLHYLASDLDHEAAEAKERMEALRDELTRSGIQATGWVGDPNPLTAIEDALREFRADEIVIATHPADQSPWLERNVVDDARRRFAPLLVTHVIVDPNLDRGAALTGD